MILCMQNGKFRPTTFVIIIIITFFIFRPLVNSIQVPKDKEELAALHSRLRKRFPVDSYSKAQKELDPNRILSNNILEKLFPVSDTI